MGRSRKPRSSAGASRRDFLKRAGVASAVLSAQPLLAASKVAPSTRGSRFVGSASDTTSPFLHGVASGDPLSDRVILWTRVTQTGTADVPVSYVIALDPALTQIYKTGTGTAFASADFTVKIDVDGLQSGSVYYYQFTALDAVSPIGRTRTLPVGEVSRMRIGVAVCASLGHGYFNAYGRISERADLDLVIHLGDYIYEYGTGQYGDVRAYEPPYEIISLDDYRTRHAQYKTDSDVQAMHRQHPVIAIWDDHEFANNCWKGGAQNHQPDTEGSWSDRVAAASQAYYEWMPTRVPDPSNLLKNNRAFSLGNLADLIMLEERVNARSEQLPPNGILPGPQAQIPTFTETGEFAIPQREMLGSEEEQWLFQLLRSSTARWKLIGQGVMFSQLKLVGLPNAAKLSQYVNPDQWDGYDPARQRVFDIIGGDHLHPKVENVVVLTGDIHSSWAADLTRDPSNPDVAAGGYNPKSGAGSHAVEFVSTSVTSPGLDAYPNVGDLAMRINPQFKYAEVTQRGYLLLDMTPARVSAEWWYVDTVQVPSTTQTFGAAWQVKSRENHLVLSHETMPEPNPPPPAP